MKRFVFNSRFVGVLACAAAIAAVLATGAYAAPLAVSGRAGVSVWVDGGDVFPDYRDVTIWLRADCDCYATLFMVDTDGFVHVLYPYAANDDCRVRGGRPYCYRASDLGLDRLDGCGIAYVFAVGSPTPFDYSRYGAGVFAGRFGFRVVGDPFVACRDFYTALLPASCRWDFVGVGYARFYVRRWERYPSYLCFGGVGVRVRAGDACRPDDVYATYRAHAAAPYDAVRPAVRYKTAVVDRDRGRVRMADANDERPRTIGGPVVVRRAVEPVGAKTVYRNVVRVVSTSRTRAAETGQPINRIAVAPQAPRMRAVASKTVRGAPARAVASRGSSRKGAEKVRRAE